MEKVIITGGDGFLGKRIEALLNKDYEIFILDKQKGRDITKIKDFEDLFTDCVIHLAALTKSQDQKEMFDVNVKGTFNVLEFCKLVRAKLIFASSAAVYGNAKSPLQEDNELNPVSFYGLTKLLGERLCDFYNTNYDLPITILRIFNLYGPGQQRGFVIPDIASQLENERIILKNPYPKRDFVYVDDVAEAVKKSIEREFLGVINIGSGKSYSIREIAEKIAEGREIKYTREGEKSDIYADISEAERVLNWKPKTSLDEGLKRILIKKV
jgi:nucleoside-diphosphate-sugar epimerase